MIFEDLHWIDSETQALLDSLVESLPTTRILLLVNYRPEYQHSWGSKTPYRQLRLDPLPPANAEELLQALLGDDADLKRHKQLLIGRPEGNPFFLEESVRTLIETGVFVGERGAHRLAKSLDSLQIPATVLAARIDRLPPEEKRLLQTAAVIGTEVPGPLLQAIADISKKRCAVVWHIRRERRSYTRSICFPSAPDMPHKWRHRWSAPCQRSSIPTGLVGAVQVDRDLGFVVGGVEGSLRPHFSSY